MEKQEVLKAIKELREKSSKKKFSQSVDLIINLQNLDLKAKGVFDQVIMKEEFPKWVNNKKEQKRLAGSYDSFVGQVEIMAQVAATFGKVLGARGKMPNPKAGCVVPGNAASLEPLAAKLQNTIRLQTKNETSVKASIGNESMKDDDLTDNVLAAYNT